MQTVLLPGRMHRQPCPPSHSPQCQQLRPAAAHRASGPLQHLRRAARQRRCLATRAGAIQELMAEELQVSCRALLLSLSLSLSLSVSLGTQLTSCGCRWP